MDRLTRQRLKWKCRRGLLELDLVLERYLERNAAAMSQGEARILGELLDLPDRDLWAIVNGASERYAQRQRGVVERLRAA